MDTCFDVIIIAARSGQVVCVSLLNIELLVLPRLYELALNKKVKFLWDEYIFISIVFTNKNISLFYF